MGQYEKAVMFFQEIVVIFEDLGEHDGLMHAFMGLGECKTWLGNYDQGVEHHKKHLTLSQHLRVSQHQENAMLNLGLTLWTQALAMHLALAVHYAVTVVQKLLQICRASRCRRREMKDYARPTSASKLCRIVVIRLWWTGSETTWS